MRIKFTVSTVLFLTFIPVALANAVDIRPSNVVTINTPAFDSQSSLATAPNGDIWVSDWTQDCVYLYEKGASNSASPIKSICLFASGGHFSSSTDASAISIDANGFLYVVDASAEKIYVFNTSTNQNQYVGDATRVISTSPRVRTIALDANNRIYAIGEYNSHAQVRIFEAGTTNASSSTPLRTFFDNAIATGDNSYGLTVLPSGEVALTIYGVNGIRIYSASASGNVSPVRTISGSDTGVGVNLGQVISDSLGRLYVYNEGLNTVSIFAPEAGGNIAPLWSIGLYAVTGPTPAARIVHYGWGLTLGRDSQIWIGDNDSKLIHFNNPFLLDDQEDTTSQSSTVNETSTRADLEAHNRAVVVAQSDLRIAFMSGKTVTLEDIKKAEINGVTTKNFKFVTEEISALTIEQRGDMKEIIKVAFKFATVNKIADHSSVAAADLISIGLVSQDSKNRTAILLELKKSPADALDTFAKIQEVIAKVEKKLSDRKARLAAILAKKR